MGGGGIRTCGIIWVSQARGQSHVPFLGMPLPPSPCDTRDKPMMCQKDVPQTVAHRPMHNPGPGPYGSRGTALGTPVTAAAAATRGGAVPGWGARPRRGLTLSEPSSGPSWQHRRHRKDLGSRHSVCRVLTKYVPPTFSRTHLEAAAGGETAPAAPAAAPAARGLGGPGAPPGPGLGVRPLGGPSAMAEPQRPPAAIAVRAASGSRSFRER